MTDEVMTIPEVASRLKVSIKTVYRRIAAGEIETVNLGSGKRTKRGIDTKMRVRGSALERYLDAKSVVV